MITLLEVKTRLENQFSDAQHYRLPEAGLEEAIRSALAQVSLFLGGKRELSGLDGAEVTTLEEEALPALIAGAAAYALEYALRRQASGLGNIPMPQDSLMQLTQHLARQFDAQLERLRLTLLQRSGTAPYASWPWLEGSGEA